MNCDRKKLELVCKMDELSVLYRIGRVLIVSRMKHVIIVVRRFRTVAMLHKQSTTMFRHPITQITAPKFSFYRPFPFLRLILDQTRLRSSRRQLRWKRHTWSVLFHTNRETVAEGIASRQRSLAFTRQTTHRILGRVSQWLKNKEKLQAQNKPANRSDSQWRCKKYQRWKKKCLQFSGTIEFFRGFMWMSHARDTS